MGHPFHSSRAAIKLGRLADGEDDLEAAEDAYRIAMEGTHPGLAGEAAYYVGNLRLQMGDTEGARKPLGLAATSESEQVARAGRLGLARLDAEETHESEAEGPGGGGADGKVQLSE